MINYQVINLTRNGQGIYEKKNKQKKPLTLSEGYWNNLGQMGNLSKFLGGKILKVFPKLIFKLNMNLIKMSIAILEREGKLGTRQGVYMEK